MTQKRSAGSHYGGVKETGGTVHGTGEFTESSNDRLAGMWDRLQRLL